MLEYPGYTLVRELLLDAFRLICQLVETILRERGSARQSLSHKVAAAVLEMV